MLPRQRVIGLTLVVRQDLALVAADLARLLGLLVADGEGGEADGGQRELGAVLGHLLAGGDGAEHALQLGLDVVVAEPLADVDVVAADVLRAHAAVVLLAEGVHKVAARQLLVHGEPAAGSGRWGFWLHLA